MQERRRYPRKQCSHDQVIEVTEKFTGRPVGRLVNMSVGGFLLVGAAPIDAETVVQLTLSAATPDGEKQISVGAVCMWTSEASSPGHYWSGFHMIDVPEESAEFFARLIAAPDSVPA